MELRSFHAHCNPQSSSSLLGKVPLELRQCIYRQLLLPPFSERTYGRFLQAKEWKDRPCLSAQLLRCCQQLYHECKAILYGENIICLGLNRGKLYIAGASFVFIDIVSREDCRELYPLRSTQPHLDIYSLDGILLARGYARPVSQLLDYEHRSWLSIYLRGIARIHRMDITVGSSSRKRVWDYVRLLRNFVQDKQIAVYWDDAGMEQDRTVELLRTFHLWRCRSLTFHNLPSAPCVDTTARSIVDLVTGQTPVIDSWFEVHCLLTAAEKERGHKIRLAGLDFWGEDSSGEDNWYDSDRERARARRKQRRSSHELSDKHDKYDLWRMIRRGDTDKLRAWTKRFSADIAQEDSLADVD